MSAPRVHVHIEELVLHGFSARDRHAIGDAVQRELAALLGTQPPVAPVSAATLDAGRFSVPERYGARAVGAGVAERIRSVLEP